MARTRERSTEVDAYIFIKENLKELGWDTRNPCRSAAGCVYTQNECLEHPEIQAQLGSDRPENIVKVTDSIYWVIEAKRHQSEIARAVDEAQEYASRISKSKNIKAMFISGVAGNHATGYLMRTRFRVGRQFKSITFNGKEISSLISPDIARTVLESGPAIADVPVDEKLFLSKAERINAHLHAGAINKNYRARVMASLLLSLIEETPPNVDAPPSILISEINARAERVLKTHNKHEFFPYIKIALPPTEDNHVKFKTALVRTIQELNTLNIRSAMNSGTDVLGQFYEVFLKYGNGAKEIGIVLTPRHVTRFAVDVIGITDRDFVYDPTCGTGGFLVAAFDHVKQNSPVAQVNRFKQHNLFGVEQEAEVVALAIVNMIFRGDGKNNIIEGSCFNKNIVRDGQSKGAYAASLPDPGDAVITRVLMNPPFALKSGNEKEYKFIDQALCQMQDGGVLFSVLPYPAMVKPGGYKHWREHGLLAKNTLLCAITFPGDLFYPVSVHSIGIFLRKGLAHPTDQNVLWIRAQNDGLLKSKGKRLPNPRAANDLETIRDLVKAFLSNPRHPVPSVARFQKACPVDMTDPLLELVAENYLDDDLPTEAEVGLGMEKVLRDTTAFLISEGIRQ
jgi:hypothetical protein